MQAERKVTSTHFANQRVLARACVLNETLYRIGMRWKMQVLYEVHHGTPTFGALRRRLPEVSDHVLAKRLRELVGEGLLDKQDLTRTRTRYHVTARGASLLAIMGELCAWEQHA